MTPARKLNEATVGGAIWLAIGLAIASESMRLGLGDFGQPGPGFMGFLAALLVIAQAAVLLWSGFARRSGLSSTALTRFGWLAALPVLALLGLYVALLPLLGFPLASFLFLLALLLLSDRSAWRQALLVSTAAVATSHVAFVVLLKVRLPAGILGLG